MKKDFLKWKEIWLYIILNKEINNKELKLLNEIKIINLLENENNTLKNKILMENRLLNIQKINELDNWRSAVYKFNKNTLINIMINDKLNEFFKSKNKK